MNNVHKVKQLLNRKWGELVNLAMKIILKLSELLIYINILMHICRLSCNQAAVRLKIAVLMLALHISIPQTFFYILKCINVSCIKIGQEVF